jgi:hypothetical protein
MQEITHGICKGKETTGGVSFRLCILLASGFKLVNPFSKDKSLMQGQTV